MHLKWRNWPKYVTSRRNNTYLTMATNIEKLPLKKRILGGLTFGVIYASLMAGYDYITNVPFSLPKFLFHALVFGFLMSIVFKYKTKK